MSIPIPVSYTHLDVYKRQRSYYFNQSVIFSSVAWFALNGLHHFAEYFFLIFTATFCGSVAPLVVKIAAFFPFRFTLSRKLNTAFGNVPHQIRCV